MSVLASATAKYSLLSFVGPRGQDLTIGVLLEDPTYSRVHIRLRRDWTALVDDGSIEEDDREILELLEDDLRTKFAEMPEGAFFDWLESSLSNTLRITDREPVAVENFDQSLNLLYRRHVAPKVLPFRTHLPVYTLKAAAGRFLENQEIFEEGWEEAPADLRLTDDLFVAHISGRSMEPKIPDGSLCVFRHGVTGSRNGRLVLVENRREGGNNRYTVKRYRSEKTPSPDGPSEGESDQKWTHSHIRLEPLNPEFEAWDIDPEDGDVQVIAEFVRVLS